jgi:photosystem I subunit IV
MQSGDKVRILRYESFWYQDIGTVVSFDLNKTRYPVIVRFNTVNYEGVNTHYFATNELETLSTGSEKKEASQAAPAPFVRRGAGLRNR